MVNREDDEVSLEQTGGFGRAAVEEAAKRPTYKSTEGQVDERDRRQEAQASMAKPKSKAKAPIVTKEQMKKAGFDNLRDYLNAQRGLKRRGDTAKPAAPAPKAEPPKATSKAEPPKAEPPKAEPPKTESSGARQGTFKRGLREFLGIDKEEPVRGVNVPSGASAVERMKKMKEEKYSKKSGGSVSYKSGGSVKSSASKRADGIAQRGKTRGRMV